MVAVVLGTLAALVGPRVSDAATGGMAAPLEENLNLLRTAVLHYRAEHQGVSPGHPDNDPRMRPSEALFIEQLARFTDETGATAATRDEQFRFGPYLDVLPVEPVTGSRRVRFVEPGFAISDLLIGAGGWVVDPATGAVCADAPGLDPWGRPYADY